MKKAKRAKKAQSLKKAGETTAPETPRLRRPRAEQFSVDPETGWTLRNGVPILPATPGRVITPQMVADWLDEL